MNNQTRPPLSKVRLDLFLISFLMLFFELACIRWFSATVIFLAFFTNILLMACFLGISIGYLTAADKKNHIQLTIPFITLSVLLACLLNQAYNHLGKITIDVSHQSQIVYFGAEINFSDPTRWVIPIWLIAGVFFTLIALTFTGVGQIAGRAFDRISNRIEAYIINLAGSIAGIAVFFIMSCFSAPAFIWFLLCLCLCLYFTRKKSFIQATGILLTLFLITFGTNLGTSEKIKEFWSPYYKVVLDHQTILVNGIGHQKMVPIEKGGPAYSLPYLLIRDSGVKSPEDILIIGAGSGNDVAAALRHSGVKARIDAVEIDPAILKIGRTLHPDKPYEDARVTPYLNDGRNFLKKDKDKRYDMIIYALVDSLALHSGYSSLRLESYLFTKEALEDVRQRLKPEGIFVMYNYYRQGWVIGRLFKMAQDVFEMNPLVFSLPYQEEIRMSDRTDSFTMIMVGKNRYNPTMAALYKAFIQKIFFWIAPNPSWNEEINGYSPSLPPEVQRKELWRQIRPSRIEAGPIQMTPTDNWPFLYLSSRSLPLRPTTQGILMMGIISAMLFFLLAKPKTSSFDWQMFFLGAGFMLLETKSIVHMSLLFGSTWVVNSIVFAAVLIATLLANLFVLKLKIKDLGWAYFFLLATLAANALIPIGYFLSLPDAIRPFASCFVVFAPIFFAGIIFAASFKECARPDVAMGSNIIGIILGGLSENFSLILGFNYLLLLSIFFYILSALLKPRLRT